MWGFYGPSRDYGALHTCFWSMLFPQGRYSEGDQAGPSINQQRGSRRGHGTQASGLPGKVSQLPASPSERHGRAGCSGNLNLIPPAFHLYRFRSGDMVNRKSNDWLNKIPTLSDLGQSVLFWAGKVLGLRKSLKNVASSSITGQLAQDVSSNY